MKCLIPFLFICAIICTTQGSPNAFDQGKFANEANAIVEESVFENAEEESLAGCDKCLFGGLDSCAVCAIKCLFEPKQCSTKCSSEWLCTRKCKSDQTRGCYTCLVGKCATCILPCVGGIVVCSIKQACMTLYNSES